MLEKDIEGIQIVNSYKYLGIIEDSSLTFQEQLKKIQTTSTNIIRRFYFINQFQTPISLNI